MVLFTAAALQPNDLYDPKQLLTGMSCVLTRGLVGLWGLTVHSARLSAISRRMVMIWGWMISHEMRESPERHLSSLFEHLITNHPHIITTPSNIAYNHAEWEVKPHQRRNQPWGACCAKQMIGENTSNTCRWDWTYDQHVSVGLNTCQWVCETKLQNISTLFDACSNNS